jgi:hypothetical protein
MVTRRPAPAPQKVAAALVPAAHPTYPFVSTKLMNLLVAAEDRAHDLLYIQQAFSALGKLVAANYEKPRAQLEADRGELTALLAIINDHTEMRIKNAIAAVEAAGRAARNQRPVPLPFPGTT